MSELIAPSIKILAESSFTILSVEIIDAAEAWFLPYFILVSFDSEEKLKQNNTLQYNHGRAITKAISTQYNLSLYEKWMMNTFYLCNRLHPGTKLGKTHLR